MLIKCIMAKVNGPLFSISAHGTIGKALTFSKKNSRNLVRFQKNSIDYSNLARSMQRIKFAASGWMWNNLTSDEKAQLEALM